MLVAKVPVLVVYSQICTIGLSPHGQYLFELCNREIIALCKAVADLDAQRDRVSILEQIHLEIACKVQHHSTTLLLSILRLFKRISSVSAADTAYRIKQTCSLILLSFLQQFR